MWSPLFGESFQFYRAGPVAAKPFNSFIATASAKSPAGQISARRIAINR